MKKIFQVGCCLLLLLPSQSFPAAVFDPDSLPPRTIAPFSLKTTDLEQGNAKAYRPWFENGAWQGDLIEYDIETVISGTRTTVTLQTDVDVGANPPVANGSNWSARATFAGKAADFWDTDRKIITSTSGLDQIPFRWDDSSDSGNELTDSQKATLDSTAVNNTQSDVLDFIRGDRSREGNGLRVRASVLGDIIGSSPVFVGAPSADFTLSGYSNFRDANKNRAKRVYVGANDGMVHAFRETDGSEVYAYIPSMLVPKLNALTKTPYRHTFFADGLLTAADANITIDLDSAWRTLLAGGLGAGEKGLFVLNITNPNLTSETSSTAADKKLVFELHADRDPSDPLDNDDDLGYIFGSPSIVRLSNDKWYVVTGNGYGSTSGTAKLYLVGLDSPHDVLKITTDDSITGNGLSAPVLVDDKTDNSVGVNNDARADFAYAGDLKGNLWKFDLRDINNLTATKLFEAGADQPITVRPDVANSPSGGFLVYFGTGSLLSEADRKNLSQQSVYAIWDDPILPANTVLPPPIPPGPPVANECEVNGVTGLLCQTLTEKIFESTTPVEITKRVRIATNKVFDRDIHRGWKVDFPKLGERMLGHPQVRGGRLQFISTNPIVNFPGNDIESWLIELNFETGGDTDKVLFDLNENGALDQNLMDKIEIDGNPSFSLAPVALNFGPGVFSQPAIARVNDGFDTLFINGLLLEFEPSCRGEPCEGGLLGGRVDIGTSISLGNSDFGRNDGYDDKFDTTEADYFGLRTEQPTTGILIPVENAFADRGLTNAEKFIALIANAELSTGATLIIGNKSWNVVEYQKLIQQKLKSWEDGASISPDDPLVFTLDEIRDTGGLKLSFENTAIIRGGLIPNGDSCVDNPPPPPDEEEEEDPDPDPPVANGHWRRGALTLHLIKFNSIVPSDPEQNRVYIRQNVTDLQTGPYTIPGGEVLLIEDGINFGGVIANPANNSGFLYESTLFWHWDLLNSQGAPLCFGDPQWEAARNNAILSNAKITELLTAEAQLLDEITNFNCAGGDCNGDAGYQALLDQLAAALTSQLPNYAGDITELAAFVADGGLGITSGHPDAGAAVTPEDLTPVQPVEQQPGPSFTAGRQSWLEIVRERLSEL